MRNRRGENDLSGRDCVSAAKEKCLKATSPEPEDIFLKAARRDTKMKNNLRPGKHKRGGAAKIKKHRENGKEEKSMQTTTALSWKDRQFFLNGKSFRILSGAIHYFRVVPDYWEDRLKKLKACGFNTVETCVCWNLHEPVEGRFAFEGIADLGRFIETARNLGLYVILRPGPYICTEWDFGGLPSWLLREKGIRLRCCDPVFLEKAGNYLRRLFAYLRPYFPENGTHLCP